MPDALGDHLYRSFLTGSCADVRIWVRKWGVGWAVHRMVLVQASKLNARQEVQTDHRLLSLDVLGGLLGDRGAEVEEGKREGSVCG